VSHPFWTSPDAHKIASCMEEFELKKQRGKCS